MSTLKLRGGGRLVAADVEWTDEAGDTARDDDGEDDGAHCGDLKSGDCNALCRRGTGAMISRWWGELGFDAEMLQCVKTKGTHDALAGDNR